MTRHLALPGLLLSSEDIIHGRPHNSFSILLYRVGHHLANTHSSQDLCNNITGPDRAYVREVMAHHVHGWCQVGNYSPPAATIISRRKTAITDSSIAVPFTTYSGAGAGGPQYTPLAELALRDWFFESSALSINEFHVFQALS